MTYPGWIRISTLLPLIEPRVIMELRILTPIQSDHVAVPVAWEVPITASLTHLATSTLKGALEFFRYIFFRAGILSMPIQVLSLFVQGSSLSSEGSSFVVEIPTKVVETDDPTSAPWSEACLPDIELMPLATSAMDDLEEYKAHFSKIGVFSLLTTLLRLKSRSTIRLKSSNPRDRPKVDLWIFVRPRRLCNGKNGCLPGTLARRYNECARLPSLAWHCDSQIKGQRRHRQIHPPPSENDLPPLEHLQDGSGI